MNSALLDFYVAKMRNPPMSNPQGKALARQVAGARLARLEKAKLIQPVFLPALKVVPQNVAGVFYARVLDAVANSVGVAYTPTGTRAALVTGAISNLDAEKVRITDTLSEKSWQDFPARSRSISGMSPEFDGLNSYLELLAPFELSTQNQLAVEIYNTAARNGSVLYWVFQALRVRDLRETGQDLFTDDDKEALGAIQKGVPTRTGSIVMDVPFTGAAAPDERLTNVNTRAYGSPVLIKAITTNLKNCLIRLSDSTGYQWSPLEIPIWGVAGYETSARPLMYLPRNYYLGGGGQMRADFINTADPALGPDEAGQVEFIYETP